MENLSIILCVPSNNLKVLENFETVTIEKEVQKGLTENKPPKMFTRSILVLEMKI